MFKELSQLASLMKQAQGMSGKVQEMKDRMAQIRCEGKSGGGMVSVEITGEFKVSRCQIDPHLIASGDREMLEDLVCSAFNHAIEKVRETQMGEMQKLTGGMNIPGLAEALGGIGVSGP